MDRAKTIPPGTHFIVKTRFKGFVMSAGNPSTGGQHSSGTMAARLGGEALGQ